MVTIPACVDKIAGMNPKVFDIVPEIVKDRDNWRRGPIVLILNNSM